MKPARSPAARCLNPLGPTLALILLCACGPAPDTAGEPPEAPPTCTNPLGPGCMSGDPVPPFDRIDPSHFLPALKTAIERADERIAAIAANPNRPTFDNTVAAQHASGRQVARIARLWYGLAAVENTPEIMAAGEEFSRLLGEHERRVLRDRALFERIDGLHGETTGSGLSPQQQRLVAETWRRFRRAGAHLDDDRLEELAEIDRRIDELDERYRQERRAATHRHELLIDEPDRLTGLPASLVEQARQAASDRGHESGWAFTLHAHSFYPFMRHFPGRAERRQLYRAWMTRYRDVLRSDEDLGRIIDRLARLRAERAAVLGFDSHLDALLDDASLPDRRTLEVLLDRLADTATVRAAAEQRKLRALARADGIEGDLQPWDWWYYRQRLLEQGPDGQADQWLPLDAVVEGAFGLAADLWGLRFRPREDLPAWHPDMKAYEVIDRGGRALGIVYLDPIHRRGKRGGAWTSQYRVQDVESGKRTLPVLAVVANLPPPTADGPALLSVDQVRTLFHEFGHALHGLLSDVSYAALAGTNVPADFVEFPALIFERWALAPEVITGYARHYRSGESLGLDVAASLARADRPTPGLETLELIAAIQLDLALHGAPQGRVPALEEAEKRIREDLRLPALVSARHHGGGLASVFARRRHGGDFRTLWSELLASDAFAAFEENGTIDRELAERLRAEILARGNARAPMASWRAFRGREPQIRYLIEARGLDGKGREEARPDQAVENTPSGE